MQYVMVSLTCDKPMMFGGTEEPCAYGELISSERRGCLPWWPGLYSWARSRSVGVQSSRFPRGICVALSSPPRSACGNGGARAPTSAAAGGAAVAADAAAAQCSPCDSLLCFHAVGVIGREKNKHTNTPSLWFTPFFHAVGAIGGEKNKQISAALAEVVQRQLGIPASRFYIKARGATMAGASN